MSNTTYAKSADAFVKNEKAAANAFGTLVQYAHETIRDVDSKNQADVLKNGIGDEEKSYRAEHPKLEAMPVAYRSAKSVIMSAVKAGVSLVRDDGSYKGKTELEKEVKAGKSEKSAVEKFTIAMNTATNVFADVDTLEDVRKCKALLAMLAETIVKAEKELAE